MNGRKTRRAGFIKGEETVPVMRADDVVRANRRGLMTAQRHTHQLNSTLTSAQTP